MLAGKRLRVEGDRCCLCPLYTLAATQKRLATSSSSSRYLHLNCSITNTLCADAASLRGPESPLGLARLDKQRKRRRRQDKLLNDLEVAEKRLGVQVVSIL